MDLLQSIMPTSWFMSLFPPEEDSVENAKLYLHIKSGSYVLPVVAGVKRIELVDYIKEISADPPSEVDGDYLENQDENADWVDYLEVNPKLNIDIWHVLASTFQDASTVFLAVSDLSIEHSKLDDGLWYTWFGRTSKGVEHKIACITSKKHDIEWD